MPGTKNGLVPGTREGPYRPEKSAPAAVKQPCRACTLRCDSHRFFARHNPAYSVSNPDQPVAGIALGELPVGPGLARMF